MIQPYEGGGFRFAPEADPQDGKFDICVADSLSRFDFFKIFPYAYNGNHVAFHGVYIDRARRVEFHMDKPLWVHTDGETEFMAKDIRLQVLDERLRMIV
jgi:diacylglycerol kinase family enzyme